MRTGTDMSLLCCREEGYPVVTHETTLLDPDKMYSLTISEPRKWPRGHLIVGTRVRDAYDVNVFTSYRDLWASFLRGGEGIKSYCDFASCPLPDPDANPSFYDFVTLAGIVRGYHGLDDMQWSR